VPAILGVAELTLCKMKLASVPYRARAIRQVLTYSAFSFRDPSEWAIRSRNNRSSCFVASIKEARVSSWSIAAELKASETLFVGH